MLSDEKRYRGLNEKSPRLAVRVGHVLTIFILRRKRGGMDGRKRKTGRKPEKRGDITYWIKLGVASEGDGKREE